MPTWGQLLKELQALADEADGDPEYFGGASPHDVLRRKYLARLSERTGRATIGYYTGFLDPKQGIGANQLSVGLGDVAGFMEAVSNVEEKAVDLFLHSPGGSAEAADAIMQYLRTQFDDIRVVVPLAAMSAATMMALSADELLMGAHSQLGPIDPQFTIATPEGPRSAPAQAIKDQFELAKIECQDPKNIGAWLPLLRSLAPGLISQCDHQRELAEEFVAQALQKHMFKDEGDAAADHAKAAAAWFADFTAFRSHGRRVNRDDAREQGIKVTDLEDDPDLQDAVLSVHHTFMHTLSGTATVKIIENHHGRAWINKLEIMTPFAAAPMVPVGPQPLPPAVEPPRASGQNRAERRRAERQQKKRPR